MASQSWIDATKKLCRQQGFLKEVNGRLTLTNQANELVTEIRHKNKLKNKRDVKKMDTTEYVNGNNLRANDLGEDYSGIFVVDKEDAVYSKEYDGKTKLVVNGSLDGSPSKLVLNQTNLRTIQEKLGFESDDWAGKKLTLITEYVDFAGKKVPAIRVKA